MITKTFRIALVAALLSAGVAGSGAAGTGEFEHTVIARLKVLGYSNITINRTLLGRAQIMASIGTAQREIILNPRTGEVLRDYSKDTETGEVFVIPDIMAQNPLIAPQVDLPVLPGVALPAPLSAIGEPLDIPGAVTGEPAYGINVDGVAQDAMTRETSADVGAGGADTAADSGATGSGSTADSSSAGATDAGAAASPDYSSYSEAPAQAETTSAEGGAAE